MAKSRKRKTKSGAGTALKKMKRAATAAMKRAKAALGGTKKKRKSAAKKRKVSRKVGGAVVRNRFRRLYREAFRLTRAELPIGMDLVLIPRGPAIPTLEQLMASLRKLLPQVARKLTREGKPS